MRNTTFPIALMIFGVIILAEHEGWLPSIHSLWALVLIAIGAAVLATEGINRSTVVSGPFLIYLGLAWAASDRHLFSLTVLFAVGMILLGATLFIARMPGIPERSLRRDSRRADPPPTA